MINKSSSWAINYPLPPLPPSNPCVPHSSIQRGMPILARPLLPYIPPNLIFCPSSRMTRKKKNTSSISTGYSFTSFSYKQRLNRPDTSKVVKYMIFNLPAQICFKTHFMVLGGRFKNVNTELSSFVIYTAFLAMLVALHFTPVTERASK